MQHDKVYHGTQCIMHMWYSDKMTYAMAIKCCEQC